MCHYERKNSDRNYKLVNRVELLLSTGTDFLQLFFSSVVISLATMLSFVFARARSTTFDRSLLR